MLCWRSVEDLFILGWRSVDSHFLNGAVTMSLSLLPIKAADTLVMDSVTNGSGYHTRGLGWFGSRSGEKPNPLTIGGPNPDPDQSTCGFRQHSLDRSVPISGCVFRVSHSCSHSDMLLTILKYWNWYVMVHVRRISRLDLQNKHTQATNLILKMIVNRGSTEHPQSVNRASTKFCLTICFAYKGSQSCLYDWLESIGGVISQDAWPKIVDTPLTLIFIIALEGYWNLFCLQRKPKIPLWLTTTFRMCDFPGGMSKTQWWSIDAHSHDQAGKVLQSVLLMRAANNSFMTDYNLLEEWFRRTHDQSSLTLRWPSFSKWRRVGIAIYFANKGSYKFLYDWLRPIGGVISQDAWPIIIDAPLTLIFMMEQGGYCNLFCQ